MRQSIQKFRKKHGNCVEVPNSNTIIFEDGAQLENSTTGVGALMPPPDDPWERAKLVAVYCEIVAQAAEDEFYDFKSYLNGTGMCPEGIVTDEEKLEHLKQLKAKATAARTRFAKARKEVKANTPFWMLEKKKEDARERQRQDKFIKQVKSIEL